MKEKRKSNIELYRIIVMLEIVAHHYVVNSGLTGSGGPVYGEIRSWRSIFLLLFGTWGKIGIDCFVLITGYFMCKSHITARKFVKLLAEVMFYKIVITAIFILAGKWDVSLIETIIHFLPVYSIHTNFTGCYLVFYLSIPFLNILINGIEKKQFRMLLALLGFVYIFLGTFRIGPIGVTMNYFSWFMVVYLIGAYIRLFPEDYIKLNNKWGIISFILIIISCLSVILSAWIFGKPYIFVMDSNALLAVITSISVFMFFLNLDIGSSNIINKIASTTFGVLLIHANSDVMRKWLWVDVFDNVGTYSKSMMPVRAIGTVIIVFGICSIIDLARQRFIEKPFMKIIDKRL